MALVVAEGPSSVAAAVVSGRHRARCGAKEPDAARQCDGRSLHVRKSSVPEPGLQKIYMALGLDARPGGVKKLVT